MRAYITFHYSNGTDNGPHHISDEGGVSGLIRKHEPFFFKTTHGKRETFEEYRGFLIVSHTAQFTGGGSERHTLAYLFNRDPKDMGTLVMDYASNPKAMRKKIDQWWLGGKFERKGDRDAMTVTLLP